MAQFASEYPDGVTTWDLNDSAAELEQQLGPLKE
jgi:hypothetical protein